jgi:heat shock protein HspQ
MYNHKLKLGDIVQHLELPTLIGVVIDIGFLGQIEQQDTDFNLNKTFEDDELTFVDTQEEYYQPWYRIVWTNSDIDDTRHTPTRSYHGQEPEDVLNKV